MKLPTSLLVSSVIFAGCSASNPADSDNNGKFLCVPSEYAVLVPGSGGSNGGFDPEGGGYGISILMDGQHVAQAISGYQTKVRVGKNDQLQSLYVMLAPSSHFQRSLSSIGATHPLDEHEYLSGEDADSLTWEIVEEVGSNQTHWGTCADQFTGTGSFDCHRILTINDLVLTYPIDQANIHLYREIDELLRAKVDQWRCDSGDIPVER